MPKHVKPNIRRKINELALIILKPDGTPNKREIARLTKTSTTTVTSTLNKLKPGILETPDPKHVQETIETLYNGIQNDIIPSMLRGYGHTVRRFEAHAADPNSDARDLAHITKAMDISTKILQLLSGRVTSRTQQDHTVKRTETIKVIAVPAKDTAAFAHADGLKQLPTSYETDAPRKDED